MPDPQVAPGPDGRWLVRDGRRLFAVPAALGRELCVPGGAVRWRQLVPGRAARRSHPALWLRVPLLPAVAVDALARRLAVLASGRALGVLVALGGLGLVAGFARDGPPLGDVGAAQQVAAVALFMVTALWHECGHAAALRREGLPAGGVGVGLLWVLPVMFCDVSACSLLPCGARVRVDVAGMAFQLGAAGVLGLIHAVAAWPAAALAAIGAMAAVLWSLTPLLRSDGHWLLLDLLGLDDLAAAPPPGWQGARGRRAILAVWRLLTVIGLGAVVLWLPWRLARVLGRRDGLGAVLAAVVALGAWRAARRATQLVRAAVRDLRAS